MNPEAVNENDGGIAEALATAGSYGPAWSGIVDPASSTGELL
jgi:hypothetical protein